MDDAARREFLAGLAGLIAGVATCRNRDAADDLNTWPQPIRIDRFTPENTGTFFNYDGEIIPW